MKQNRSKKLTEKQKLFVAEYLVDLNATKAYIRAGYSPKSANECAARMLANASIQQLISESLRKRTDKLEITSERILSELAYMGFSNMLDYIGTTEFGDAYVDLSSLTREQAKAIQEITVEAYTEGRGEDTREIKRTKFKLADKRGSLELLGKHLKLFTDRHEHHLDLDELSDNQLLDLLARLEGQSRRLALLRDSGAARSASGAEALQ
jgi:phage terminase small subunit